jgi:lipid-binding SYLF domain-containing protein
MKALLSCLILTVLACSVLAVDKTELDNRIRKLRLKLVEMQAHPDKRIPPEELRRAAGVVLLDRTKGGFVFAFQGGSGVVLAKDARSGRWSPPAFVSANEASLGFQAGGQQSFVVILLMNSNAVRLFAQGDISFGGEAGGTAGNVGGRVQDTTSAAERLVQVYTDSEGLFGGAAIKAGGITPDSNANLAYHDEFLAMKDILVDRKGKSTPAAAELTQKLSQYSSK